MSAKLWWAFDMDEGLLAVVRTRRELLCLCDVPPARSPGVVSEWHHYGPDSHGQPVRGIRLRLDRAIWLEHRRDDIEIEGLGACLEMFGAGAAIPDRNLAGEAIQVVSSSAYLEHPGIEHRGSGVDA